MKNRKQLLLIFVKNPELGKVKTRLAASIGDQRALDVYQLLLSHTYQVAKDIQTDKRVCYSGFVQSDDLWSQGGFQKTLQTGKDLGIRMSQAFRAGFEEEYDSICIIGSDCIDLTVEILQSAFNELKKNDFVVGPAKDGGYYLLGMNFFAPKLFTNKEWSTESVCKSTLEDIDELRKKVHLLPVLSDVDNIEDLKRSNLLNKLYSKE